MAGRAMVSWLRRDQINGGNYRITGTASRLGVPGKYHLFLYKCKLMNLIRDVWSSKDGSYQFNNINYLANGYFVIEIDNNETLLNSAIADLVTPELMP